MSKSPEEYFQDQHFAPEPQKSGVTFSVAEIAFMRKYMGLDAQETLEKLGIKAEVPTSLEAARPVLQAAPAPEAILPEVEPEALPEGAPQEMVLPEAAPDSEFLPATIETASPPAAKTGDSELSAAAQALSAAASALTAAASALSVNAASAPTAFFPEPAPVAEPGFKEPAVAPASEPVMEEPAVEFELEPVESESLENAPAPVVQPDAETEHAAEAAAPEPETPAAPASPAIADRSEVETFKETVDQQFMIIKAALDGLKQNGADTSLSDALFRGLSTVQSSASYMGFDEIRVYAERTAGIVNQGRKSGTDFSILTALLEQEAEIIEDMVFKAISDALGAAMRPAVVSGPPPVEAPAPMAEPAPEPAPPPAPEEPAAPAANVAPAPPSTPAPEPSPAPVYVETPPEDLHEEMAKEEALDVILRREDELQMVGFYIGRQEFTVPTMAVQEVIRYETPAKMPAAPPFVAGVINLRGKMTPLVHLRDMLEIRQPREGEDRFIVVCRRKGLQIGLIIERVHTMYRVPQTDIEWGVEGLLGISNADFISGLLKLHESLVGIVSVDRIIDYVIEEE